MTFFDVCNEYREPGPTKLFNGITSDDISNAVFNNRGRVEDLAALLSPRGEGNLEVLARRAHELTTQHFGRTMHLFTPLYLSNFCVNQCAYCGYNAKNAILQRTLNLREVGEEGGYLASKGFKHILILTGESAVHSSLDYIADCVSELRERFSSVSIDVYPMTEDDYSTLVKKGTDGMTLFQETYSEEVYDRVHLAGPKKDYRFRLEAPERAAGAGMRTVNIGALLGLNDWRTDAFFVGLHAKYLQDKFPDCEISISVPRIRGHKGMFDNVLPVSDKDLVQMVTALRIFLPRVGITLSTRENAFLRDHLVPLGITKMSAESDTSVGGHLSGDPDHGEGQFDVSDRRSLDEIKQMLMTQGYQPIMKDWVGA
jgi:2-iminoacetate synthase